MGAFFSIQIGCGVKNFGSQTPWSKNWCLVQELVFNSYCAVLRISKLRQTMALPLKPDRGKFVLLVSNCRRRAIVWFYLGGGATLDLGGFGVDLEEP
jgi:hypothetical protein